MTPGWGWGPTCSAPGRMSARRPGSARTSCAQRWWTSPPACGRTRYTVYLTISARPVTPDKGNPPASPFAIATRSGTTPESSIANIRFLTFADWQRRRFLVSSYCVAPHRLLRDDCPRHYLRLELRESRFRAENCRIKSEGGLAHVSALNGAVVRIVLPVRLLPERMQLSPFASAPALSRPPEMIPHDWRRPDTIEHVCSCRSRTRGSHFVSSRYGDTSNQHPSVAARLPFRGHPASTGRFLPWSTCRCS